MTVFEDVCNYLRTVSPDKDMTNWTIYEHTEKCCHIGTLSKCLRLLERGGYLTAGKDHHGYKWFKVTNKPIPIGLTESELKARLEVRKQRLDRKYTPSTDLTMSVDDLTSTIRTFKSIMASLEDVQAQEITLSRIKRLRATHQRCTAVLGLIAHKLDAIHEIYTFDLENLIEQQK